MWSFKSVLVRKRPPATRIILSNGSVGLKISFSQRKEPARLKAGARTSFQMPQGAESRF